MECGWRRVWPSRRVGNEAGEVSGGQIITGLNGFIKEFRLYPRSIGSHQVLKRGT